MWTAPFSPVIKVEWSCNCCLREIIFCSQKARRLSRSVFSLCCGQKRHFPPPTQPWGDSMWGNGGTFPLEEGPDVPLNILSQSRPEESIICLLPVCRCFLEHRSGSAGFCLTALSGQGSFQLRPTIKSPRLSAETGWRTERLSVPLVLTERWAGVGVQTPWAIFPLLLQLFGLG